MNMNPFCIEPVDLFGKICKCLSLFFYCLQFYEMLDSNTEAINI